MDSFLQVNDISKTYFAPGPAGAGTVCVPTLQEVSFDVKKGEFLCFIGPSGSGKSTLFNIISGLESPDRGSIWLDGKEITNRKGFVSYMLQKDLLLPWRTVLDNCILGLELQSIPPAKARAEASRLLTEFGIADFAGSYPTHLSGGMRQRVAFLRTILSGRELLLLDEPFGALDSFTKRGMHEWFLQVWQKYRPTVLFITHDIEEALFLADRLYVLSPRPAKIEKEIIIDLPRPRSHGVVVEDRFVSLKKELLTALFAPGSRHTSAGPE